MPKHLSLMIQAGLPMMSFMNTAQIVEGYAFEEEVGNSLVVKEPVGVIGAITPWNYPLHQIAAKVAPALAAGCTVVLKPSEVAPLNAFILAEVIEAAGLPAGVFNLLTGTGRQARSLDHLGEDEGVERRHLARLEHHRAAGGEGGRDLGRDLVQREVPGGDRAEHADRLAQHPRVADLLLPRNFLDQLRHRRELGGGQAGLDDPAQLDRHP